MSETFYDVLNIGRNATSEEIQRAFRRQRQLFHPDKATGAGVTDERVIKSLQDRFNIISEAGKVLGDQARRSQYDASLDRPHNGTSSGGYANSSSDWEPSVTPVWDDTIAHALKKFSWELAITEAGTLTIRTPYEPNEYDHLTSTLKSAGFKPIPIQSRTLGMTIRLQGLDASRLFDHLDEEGARPGMMAGLEKEILNAYQTTTGRPLNAARAQRPTEKKAPGEAYNR